MAAGNTVFQQYVRVVGALPPQAPSVRSQIPITRLRAHLADHLESAGRRGQRQSLSAGLGRFGQASGLMVVLRDREKLSEHEGGAGSWGARGRETSTAATCGASRNA